MVSRAAAMIVVLLLSLPTPAAAETIDLPRPQSEQLNGFELFEMLGLSRDRLPGATVPGAVTNDERVNVAVDSDGSVEEVHDQQRIQLTGEGDYHIREAGPAQSVDATGDEPPVLDFGDIVWQGFSIGSRQLGADLTLDPQIESDHLPLRVRLSFAGTQHAGAAVLPSASITGPGTVTVTITNATRQPMVLPTAADAPAKVVAAALDSILNAARDGALARLPTIRTILPTTLPVTRASTRRVAEFVPIRLSGELRFTSGVAGSTSAVNGVRPHVVSLDAMLQDSVHFSLTTHEAGTLVLDLTAMPALDLQQLTTPRGFGSWAAWAAAGPNALARKSALDLLVQTAAVGAWASAYSPYLGPHLGPAGSTVFHYALAAAAAGAAPTQRLKPKVVPIVITALAAVLVAAGGIVVWRRS